MHVKCFTVKQATPSDDGDEYQSARSKVGRMRVISILVSPYPNAASQGGGTSTDGEIIIYDSPALTNGTAITGGVDAASVRFAIHYGGKHSNVSFSVLPEVDGYILMEQGIMIDSKIRTGGESLPTNQALNPLLNCKVDVLYV